MVKQKLRAIGLKNSITKNFKISFVISHKITGGFFEGEKKKFSHFFVKKKKTKKNIL